MNRGLNILNKQNQTTIKDQNQYLILDTIRRKSQITRIDLAAVTGLSTAAVTNITAALLASDLIKEVGRVESPLGRKPVLLQLNQRSRLIIGIDIGRDSLRACLAQLDGQLLDVEVSAFDLYQDGEHLPERISEVVRSFQAKASEYSAIVAGAGVVAPGLPELPEAADLVSTARVWPIDIISGPYSDYVSQQTGLPILTANATDMAALAESWFGQAQSVETLIYLTIGSGVKAGLVVNGQPYPGKRGFTPEFGHTTIDIHGKSCWCGNRGCLELYTSRSAILEQALRNMQAHPDSLLHTFCANQPDQLTVDQVFQAARQADQAALNTIQTLVDYLGAGIVNLINLYDPDLILIGTREMPVQGLDDLLPPLKEALLERALPHLAPRVQLGIGSFGGNAYLMGAVTLVANELFSPTGCLDLI